MNFKGGPDDRKYRSKVMQLCQTDVDRERVRLFKEALATKFKSFLRVHTKRDNSQPLPKKST